MILRLDLHEFHLAERGDVVRHPETKEALIITDLMTAPIEDADGITATGFFIELQPRDQRPSVSEALADQTDAGRS